MCNPEQDVDLERLKTMTVEGDVQEYSFGQKRTLDDQFAMLEREFVGRTHLEFHHAKTIVRIRRKQNLAHNVATFWKLWTTEADFLLEHLDSRWLVSACDTIVDVVDDHDEKMGAMFGAFVVNTVKLYETERHLTDRTRLGPEHYDLSVLSQRLALFDGLSGYLVNRRGNMLPNLLMRLDGVLKPDMVSHRILEELVRRLHTHDTVFRRFTQYDDATGGS